MSTKTYPALPNPEPKAIVAFCGDPRFQSAIASFITDELGFKPGEYILFSVPGGIASLSEQFALPKDFKVTREGLAFYLEHMGSIQEVVLINHEDCKKYRALCTLRNALDLKPEKISQRQYGDLHKVSAIVAKIVPRALTVKRYYAKFSNSEHTEVTFEEV